MDDPDGYWREGTKVIEACLEKAKRADFADAPVPLDHYEAGIWHEAQAQAYRHALETMGHPALQG